MTADFVHSRLRKTDYTEEDRAEIADRTKRMVDAGKDLYVFFKHEDTPAGALYAEELLLNRRQMESGGPSKPSCLASDPNLRLPLDGK